MQEFGVSRTVVREAISKLQAAGPGGHAPRRRQLRGRCDAAVRRLSPRRREAGHAARRGRGARAAHRHRDRGRRAGRAAPQRARPAGMREALDQFERAVRAGRDAVAADFRFHREIARATQNPHFAGLSARWARRSSRAPARTGRARPSDERRAYLRRVNAEHESIFDAIANQDADGRARGDAHAPGQQPRTAAPRRAGGRRPERGRRSLVR